MEDPDFAKQNDRDSAARPLTDIPSKLLKEGFDVPPRQAAAYTGREKISSRVRWCFRFIPAWYCHSVLAPALRLLNYWILVTPGSEDGAKSLRGGRRIRANGSSGMDIDPHSIEDLKDKANFLKREKQRLLEAQKKRDEIDRLQREVAELSAKELALTKPSESDLGRDLNEALAAGQWQNDASDERVLLEAKWEEEKVRLADKKKKDKEGAHKFAWGVFGTLAIFFPIFWPFFILQGFRAYPVTSFAILALIVFLLIVLTR